MGDVKRMLHTQEIAPKPDMYAGKRSIEAAESMHIHDRNTRMEYTPEEIRALAKNMEQAMIGWNGLLSGKTNWLCVSAINPVCGVTPTRFDIEETEYPTLDATTIHIHYRNLRLEFSHAEWEQFAGGIIQAMGKWADK